MTEEYIEMYKLWDILPNQSLGLKFDQTVASAWLLDEIYFIADIDLDYYDNDLRVYIIL